MEKVIDADTVQEFIDAVLKDTEERQRKMDAEISCDTPWHNHAAVSVTDAENTVFLLFGKELRSASLSAESAVALAMKLLDAAANVDPELMTKICVEMLEPPEEVH